MPARTHPQSSTLPLWCATFVCTAAVLPQLPLHAEVDFNHQIVPILRKHCGECHTGDKLKGGFSMNDRDALLHGSENGPVIDLENPAESLLLELIATDDTDMRMPPKGDGLSAEEVALLRKWVGEKLPWEAGFAFKQPAYEPPLRPRHVELPPVMDGRENPVDRLMDAYLADHNLPRPPQIDDGAFLRRAHLDLIGLLPTPEEFAAFTADADPAKRHRLVRDLLARDVEYTEHWLTFWNDLLRNDYGGTGFITGGRKQISKWLYASLLNNKPFDQFARELIAPPGDDSRGFIDGIRWRGEVSAGQTVEIQFAQNIGQTFLGINLKCASCHDSFIDRWKLDEAYGMAAIYADKPLEVHRCDIPSGRTATASWIFPELGQVDPNAPREERLKQLAALMTHPENGRFTRTIVNRLWHRLMGHGIVHPLDSMQSEPWNPDLLDFLAGHLQENGYDLKKTLGLIATSHLYQSRAEIVADNSGEFTFKGPRARRLTAEQFVDAVWQITGSAPAKMDADVVRGKPDSGSGSAPEVKIGARWIWGESAAGDKVPPSGESIALRHSFTVDANVKSASAVITCDNEYTLFFNGKLLGAGQNWEQVGHFPLAPSLRNRGANEILVVAKNAGSGPNPAGLFMDIRIVLEDGGERRTNTDGTWEWSPTLPDGKGKYAQPATDWKPAVVVPTLPAWSQRTGAAAAALLAQQPQGDGRMVRSSLLKSDFLMRSLGRPNRDQIVSMRPDELTTLEAIDLSNGATLATALQKGAENLAKRQWASGADLVQWIYAHALARTPAGPELAAALEALGEKPTATEIADVLWAVIMQPEFQFVH